MDGVRAILFAFAESWVVGLFGLAEKPVWMRSNQFSLIGEPMVGLTWSVDRMARTTDGRLLLDVAAAENFARLKLLREFLDALPVAETAVDA